MASARPFADLPELLSEAERVWNALGPADWLEAFSHHPRIGDLRAKFGTPDPRVAKWAAQEQKGAAGASEETLRRLADGNAAYERKFGYIFLVCATGKTAEEMLGLLESRLGNEPGRELGIAASEQAKITRIRLEKLLI
jgi:2-oxo-4-hydroxy-4-carboxy-5-ureidoimidazoline decarboxylase